MEINDLSWLCVMNAMVHGHNHVLSFKGINDLCSPLMSIYFGVIHFNLIFKIKYAFNYLVQYNLIRILINVLCQERFNFSSVLNQACGDDYINNTLLSKIKVPSREHANRFH